MPFDDRVIWITGASSGLGEALAYAFAARGARLILSARREERLEQVRQQCNAPERHRVLTLDLAETEALDAKTREAIEQMGRVDVLVNNGGISQRSLIKDTRLEVDRRIMEIDYFAAVALTKAVLPHMMERGSGQIVAISSLVGKISTPMRSAYAAAKHALVAFMDALRAEVHDAGIAVTVVCPGYIRTEIAHHALTGEGSEHARASKAIEAGMDPQRVAEAVVRAVERRRDELIIGGRERYAVHLKRFFPGLFNRLIRRIDTA